MKGQRGFVQLEHARSAKSAARSGLWQMLARWYQLGQQRRALASLSDNALKDLGLSRADIYTESERPFWDDPLKK